MALVTFGGGVTAISGRIGGNVFSKTGSVRAGTIPTNPNTAPQQEVRGLIALLSNVWINTLTQAQRDAWATYAANVTVPNRLGAQIQISGIAHYIRSNVARLQALPSGSPVQSRVDAAPVIFDIGGIPVLSGLDASVAAGVIAFEFSLDEAPAAGDRIMIYLSREQNPTVNYFRGPFQLTNRLIGNALQPMEANPRDNILTLGNKIFMRAVYSRTDGRMSGAGLAETIVVA